MTENTLGLALQLQQLEHLQSFSEGISSSLKINNFHGCCWEDADTSDTDI